ncbi:DUF937 domain-containing protein [Stenotrophomonas cyclobalanopsidis]|uniref:DUF937 domain-containing protein n=1 Tax=Stenotrophomonas cyclobalanopsidis TaxID=2771362 RepID=A0ABQ6SYY6_9GAMM|nr:DUF937 domain-containing protein [Stenotrophomonas cyclobalanopsidis]KAA8996290.1 DUF937 domain-containing protein [Stenotrophomonas cyclobalanopsidis]
MLGRSFLHRTETAVNTESLAASLFQQLQQGQGLQQVSQQLGLDSSQTTRAVGSALPLLLGAMGQNASEPQGAQSLLNALQRDHLGGGSGGGFDLGGILGAVMGGGGSGATDGAGILGHVFGGQQPQAAELLGQKTGLDSGTTGKLLAILAPIVMSFLAQRFAQQGNAGELSSALGQETQHAGGLGSLIGGALDQDGDGQFGASDLLKLGAGLLKR